MLPLALLVCSNATGLANSAITHNTNKPPVQFTESGHRILGAGAELTYSNSVINQGKASECPTARARQARGRGKVTELKLSQQAWTPQSV